MSKHVKDIMSSNPTCCTPQSRLTEVAKMMVDHDCGEIPVVASATDRRPIGVVTDRDIVTRMLARNIDPIDKTARDCMSEPVITVRPDTDLDECCDLMESHQIRRVPVIDEAGQLIGIVAQADVALAAGKRAVGDTVRQISQPGASHH